MSVNNAREQLCGLDRSREISRRHPSRHPRSSASILAGETISVENRRSPKGSACPDRRARRSNSPASPRCEDSARSATLGSLAIDLESGRTSSVALVESCLAALRAGGADDRASFVQVNQTKALAVARAMDSLRKVGAAPSPFAGIPISIGDQFDVQGENTRDGSKIRAAEPPASRDAAAVNRLRQMGFVLIGRTDMSELANSGVGPNLHPRAARAARDRARGCAPGMPSSGAALSVAGGMAYAAIATDTGGACRIPAAFNRLVGFKPTADRISRHGIVPLSTSLGSVGTLARSTNCCATLDEILSAEPVTPLPSREVAGLRIAVPTSAIYEGVDADVGWIFESFLSRLDRAGARLTELSAPEFVEATSLQSSGGIATAEGDAVHRRSLYDRPDDCDLGAAGQIERGAAFSAADYLDLVARRTALIHQTRKRFDGFDAFVMPTVAIVPPPPDPLRADDEFSRLNLLALRNPSIINLIDGCAVSLPIGEPGDPPVGATIAGLGGSDRNILAIAAAIESLLAPGD